LGLLGNTGNSDGAHLHLELRASTDPNLRSIAGRVVINPRAMFAF
jgi:murein DD-endopeptidase MepM/ murein hydrolase activator NlpD